MSWHHEDYLSLAQSIATTLAIFGAFRVALYQHRLDSRAQRRTEKARTELRVDLVMRLAKEAEDTLQLIVECTTSTRSAREYLLENADKSAFNHLQLALDAIPIWDLPSSDLVTPVLMIRQAFARASIALEGLSREVRSVAFAARDITESPARKILVEQAGYAQYALRVIVDYARSNEIRIPVEIDIPL
ncbi:hypothetical protein KDW41_12180 [Burkholderia vietnamiensis]|nr:hypothetical protein [Burkholderia vietnamiensis]